MSRLPLSRKQFWRRQQPARSSSRNESHNFLYDQGIQDGNFFRSSSAPTIGGFVDNISGGFAHVWATTGNLRLEQKQAVKNKVEDVKKKRVHFLPAVRVVLIPTRTEYTNAGLAGQLWFEQSDYTAMKNSAVRELKVLMTLKNIRDSKQALEIMYQPNYQIEIDEEAISRSSSLTTASYHGDAETKERRRNETEVAKEEEATAPADDYSPAELPPSASSLPSPPSESTMLNPCSETTTTPPDDKQAASSSSARGGSSPLRHQPTPVSSSLSSASVNSSFHGSRSESSGLRDLGRGRLPPPRPSLRSLAHLDVQPELGLLEARTDVDLFHSAAAAAAAAAAGDHKPSHAPPAVHPLALMV